jgi:hypothetical protein
VQRTTAAVERLVAGAEGTLRAGALDTGAKYATIWFFECMLSPTE